MLRLPTAFAQRTSVTFRDPQAAGSAARFVAQSSFSSGAAAMASVTKVPESALHLSKPTWWLESRFHFSFADWWDTSRVNFGALRVVNDDLVKPRAGFGAHPHRDAEIFSYVVDGELSHRDSMGNQEALGRGCVQYMSAGTGVVHSEMNEGGKTCRFLQIWLTPDARGHEPQYGSRRHELADRHNRMLWLLGGTGPAPDWKNLNTSSSPEIHLHQDSNVIVSENDAGVTHDIVLGPSRQAYLICIEGSMQVLAPQGVEAALDKREAVQLVAGPKPLHLSLASGPNGAHWLMVEMKQQK